MTQAFSPSIIRVVLAEDHTIVREGLRALLAGQRDLEVVGEARDGRQAIEVCHRLRPRVLILDLSLPRLNGIEVAREISRTLPECRVLVLSMHAGADFARAAANAKVAGFLVKGAGISDLVTAVREVAAGGSFFCRQVALVLQEDFLQGKEGKPRPADADRLSARERQVLQLVAEGHTSRQIASLLGISSRTVEAHRAHIMEKLHLQDLAGLVRYAVRLGLVQPEE